MRRLSDRGNAYCTISGNQSVVLQLTVMWLLVNPITCTLLIPIKIVGETTGSAGHNAFNSPYNSINQRGNQQTHSQGRPFQPKVSRANFSGPGQLLDLVGSCFSFTTNKYRYDVCPFDNITQHELSTSHNAYQGILGIWSGEWDIVNNTFEALVFENGDQCGQSDRKVRMRLLCGAVSKVVNVIEPSVCNYEIQFQTDLVCHEDALLVYPRLSEQLQHRWDSIETSFYEKELTQKGYHQELNKIFIEAGLKNKRRHSAMKGTSFKSVGDCLAAYYRLVEKIKELKIDEA